MFVQQKRLLFSLLFLLSYASVIVFALPPLSLYTAGETLDPACAPGDTNCSVNTNPLPDQTGNAGSYLTTDGVTASWEPIAAGPGGTVTSFTFTNGNGFTGIVSNTNTTPTLSLTLQNATTTQAGQLTSADWNTFNTKFDLPSLTPGSILFSDGSTIAQDNANLFYNNTTKTLSLGTSTPEPSSIFDIASTTRGFLTPRMTTVQRDAIVSPATGLLVFNTSTNTLDYYNGVAWVPFVHNNSAWTTYGNLDTDPSTNFIGTADNNALNFRVNDKQMMSIPTGLNQVSFQDPATSTTNPAFSLNVWGTKFRIMDRNTIWLSYDSVGGVSITPTTTVTALYASSTIKRTGAATARRLWELNGTQGTNVDLATNPHYSFGNTVAWTLNPSIPNDTFGSLHAYYDATSFPVSIGNRVTNNYTMFLRSSYAGNDNFTGIYYDPIFTGTPANHIAMALGSGRVGIGTLAPNTSALVDITSTTQGFLAPRMITVQRDAITSPATGLQIYNTTTAQPEYYNGSAWGAIGGGGLGSLANIGVTPNANGATITGTVLNLQPASATFGGVVTTGTQTFAGEKTFQAQLNIAPISPSDDVFLNAAIPGTGIMRFATNGAEKLRLNTSFFTSLVQFRVNTIAGQAGPTSGPITITSNSSGATSPNVQLLYGGFGGGGVRTMLGIGTGQTLTGGVAGGQQIGGMIINPTLNFTFADNWTGIDINPTVTGAMGNNYGLLVRSGQVGIGTGAPHTSSLVDMTSTTQGFLVPRMTSAQRDAIVSPATGLQVYNTTTGTPEYYTGTSWASMSGASSWSLLGNAGTNPSTTFLGTTDAQRLVFRTNNIERMTILDNGNVGIGTATPLYQLQAGNSTVSGIVARFQNSTGTCDINPTTTALTCSSDQTLKSNIVSLDSALSSITALRPVTYTWNTDTTQTQQVGFIAQEVEQVFPNLVFTDLTTGLKSLASTNLIPYTIKALQDMNTSLITLDDIQTPNLFRAALVRWFSSATNGIQSFFSKKVITEELCVGTEDSHVCLNKNQIETILINQQGTAYTPPAPVLVDEEVVLPEATNSETSPEEVTREALPETGVEQEVIIEEVDQESIPVGEELE